MDATRKLNQGTVGDDEKQPDALVVSAICHQDAGHIQNESQRVRQEVRACEAWTKGRTPSRTEKSDEQTHDHRNEAEESPPELPIAKNHAFHVVEAGPAARSSEQG